MFIRRHRVAQAVALSLSVPALSLAAGSEQLSEVIVTATAFHGAPDDVVHPVVVLSGDALRQQMGSSLGETLARQPGITATWYGPAASRPIIRGLGGDRVMVLEDGVAALDLSGLSEDHATSTEDAVARQIEIVKGPATLLYGSGAVGGAVNVVTRRIPSQQPMQGLQSAAELRGDSASKLRAGVGTLDAALGEDLSVHADGHYTANNDIRIPGGTLANSDSHAGGGSLGISLLNDAGFVGLSAGALMQNYGIPQAAGSPPGGPRIDMKQTRVALRGEQSLGDGPLQRVSLSATHSLYEHAELEGDGSVGTQFKQNGTEARVALDHLLGDFKGTVGVQYRRIDFSTSGTKSFVPATLTNTPAAFAFEQYAAGPVTLEGGLRTEYQHIAVTATPAQPSYSGLATSGSLGALWRITAPVALAFNVTHSDRHPSATELYAKGAHDATQQYLVGDSTLHRETATDIDLTLRGTQGLRWELSVYSNRFKDYIYLAPTPQVNAGLPVFNYKQADATFEGFEAELTLPLLQGGSRTLDLRLAADSVRGRLVDGSNLPQLPPLHFGGELLGNWGDWTASASAWRYTAQHSVASYETPTDGYTLVGASLNQRWTLGEQSSLLLFFNGSNLTDQLARRHSSPLKAIAPLPGRSVTAGLRLAL
jgi:iron complex outermembrane receptor protein